MAPKGEKQPKPQAPELTAETQQMPPAPEAPYEPPAPEATGEAPKRGISEMVKESKFVKVIMIGACVVGGAVGLEKCNGDDKNVGYQGDSVDGAPPAKVTDQLTGVFQEAADSDISCETFPGLELNMTSFSVNGKEEQVVKPDVRDALPNVPDKNGNKVGKYTDAIAGPLKGESDNAKKLDLYTSFCDNPYLATVTANFLADLELPNGEKVADNVDWLKEYKNIEDVNDIAKERFPFTDNAENDPAKLLEGMKANEELAANLISVFEQLRYKGYEVSNTRLNVHAPFPAANGEFPEDMVNDEQMRAKGIGFNFVYKTDNGKGAEVLCLMFNNGDKRPEIVDCRNPKGTPETPSKTPPKTGTPPTKKPPKKCVPPNPDCTPPKKNPGKDHKKSPVSGDRNHEDERVRPNIKTPPKAIQQEGAGEDKYVPPATVTDPRPEGQQTPDQTPASGTDNGNEDGTNGTVEGP